VKDTECVDFLQWALPRLGLRWYGFQRVRGQVCKRIDRRIHALGLGGPAAYTAYLGEHPEEWAVLDGLCTVSISRFYRDRAVFDYLGDTVLPILARAATSRAEPTVRCWSAGCASGEEPYTLSLIWRQRISLLVLQARLTIIATDTDDCLLSRARVACYARSSLKELPQPWIDEAFIRRGDGYCLGDVWKACVELHHQDIRHEQPSGPFDLVLCRNLAFTYFDEPMQRRTVERLAERMPPAGYLVVGRHETLPAGAPFVSCAPGLGVYQRAP
jgi:chemotaxis protein methyltransferase CheR